MLCLIPFFSKDKDQAVRLSNWLRDLGGVKNHDCLLVVDKSTDESGVIEPLSEAFRSVDTCHSIPTGAQGTWGSGTTDATAANEMFMTGAIWVYHKKKVPFFWKESDAAPTRSTWLDEIEAEYKACGKPFMGMRVDMPPHEVHMSGIGVYPWNVADHSLAMMTPGQIAWDYAGRNDTVKRGRAHFTKLIQHVYRINGTTPEWPTFPTLESLSQINPETAVFHRCKDESLVDRLRERINSLENKVDPPPGFMTNEGPLELASGRREKELLSRIADLEQQLAAKRSRKRGKRMRTIAEQAVFDERMARARSAIGKKKLTGVK